MTDKLKQVLTSRPQTKPQRKILSQVDKVTALPEDRGPGTVLTQLMDNSPSSVLTRAEIAIDACQSLMTRIEGTLKDDSSNGVSFEEYKGALSNGEYATIDAYEDGHFNSIEGKPEAELYGSLFYMQQQMADMKELVELNNYGQRVNSDSATKQDTEMFEVMAKLEKTEEGQGQINYTSAALDTQINAAMGFYFGDCVKFLEDATDIIDCEPADMRGMNTKDAGVAEFLKDTFESENRLNHHDRRKLRTLENSSTRHQAASIMYRNRNNMMRAMKARAGMDAVTNQDLKEQLINAYEQQREASDKGILDFYKTNSMEKMYRSDFTSTVGRKQKVRQFHSQ